MFVDKKTSTTDDNIKINNIKKEKTVCLATSIFIFSLFLSFKIDLYNLNPLTAKANIAGINKMFCNSNNISTIKIPCGNPITVTQIEIVYPKQNPLYKIIPNTIGTPNYCCSKKP